MPQQKPFYQRAGNRTDFQKYPAALDTADTIYAANYLLGYFRTAMDAGGYYSSDNKGTKKTK